MRQVYVTYEEAQKLRPIFMRTRKSAPWADARDSSSRILQSLETVKEDVEYEPKGGYRMLLNETDYNFLMDVMAQMELK